MATITNLRSEPFGDVFKVTTTVLCGTAQEAEDVLNKIDRIGRTRKRKTKIQG